MSSLGRAVQELRKYGREVDRGAALVLISCAAIIILVRSNGSVASYNRHFGEALSGHTWRAVMPYLYWFGFSLVSFFAVPLLISRVVLKVPWRETGIGLGDWRLGLRICAWLLAIMLPVVAAVSYLPSFASKYPLSGYAARQAVALGSDGSGLLWVVVVYELGYLLYFLGWEYLFRGFMTIVLARYIGTLAVLVQMVPFAILHVGKPQPEALGSIVAGLALGILALRTRSMWWGFLLHAAVALSMDLFAILARLARS